MILLKSTDTLEVLLAGAITTSQPVLFSAFADMAADGSTFAPGNSSGTTNSTTAVTWIASPASGDVRQAKYLSLYNADTVAVTATVRLNDGTNTRILGKFQLQTGERLGYVDGNGFQLFAADGALKTSASVADGDKGDITVTGSGGAWAIDANAVSTAKIADGSVTKAKLDTTAKLQAIQIACSDETTAITSGTAKVTFRMPFAFTVTDARASLTTAQTGNGAGGIFTVDVNEGGTSILSTKITIDNAEKTSQTGATAKVVSDTALADDAEITIDIDQIGDGTAKGLKVTLIGYQT